MTRISDRLSRLRGQVVSLCGAVILLTVPAHAQTNSVATKHVRPEVAAGQARRINLLPQSQHLQMAITLQLRDEAALDDLQQQIYNPSGQLFHNFLSMDDFTAKFGPSQNDYDKLVNFLLANGMKVTGRSENRLVVDVNASVADINRVFHVTMGNYEHPSEGRLFFSPDHEPKIDLDVPLWHIGGLDNYSKAHALYHVAPAGAVTSNATGSGQGAGLFSSPARFPGSRDASRCAWLVESKESVFST